MDANSVKHMFAGDPGFKSSYGVAMEQKRLAVIEVYF
jgi:hypothetical protein